MPTRTQTHSKVAHGQVSKHILHSSPHYLRMSLNNPVQLPDDGPASWNTAEENAMIDYLIEHKAEAGDGCHFKDTTWTKVAECLQSLRTEGGVKMAKKCKEKWGRVRAVVRSLITPADYNTALKIIQYYHALED